MHVITVSNRGISDTWLQAVRSRTSCKAVVVMVDDIVGISRLSKVTDAVSSIVHFVSPAQRHAFCFRLQSYCDNQQELMAVDFFLGRQGEKANLSQLRNCGEIYTASLLQRENVQNSYPVLFLDDDVCPPRNFSNMLEHFDGETLVFGGYLGQPPFRVYWEDTMKLGTERLCELIALVNFSGDSTLSSFKRVILDTLARGYFDHRKLYKVGEYTKRHFMGGTNLRPVSSLGHIPCVPINCRGDDVFQSMLMSMAGARILFLPHTVFLHRRRPDNFSPKHVTDGILANDMLGIFNLISLPFLSSEEECRNFLARVKIQRCSLYENRYLTIRNLIGQKETSRIASFGEVINTNDEAICGFVRYLKHYQNTINRALASKGDI